MRLDAPRAGIAAHRQGPAASALAQRRHPPVALAKLTPNRFAAARQLMPSSCTAATTRVRKSTDKGPIPRRLRFGAPQESDFQRRGNSPQFNLSGFRSNAFEMIASEFVAKKQTEGRAAATVAKGEWLIGIAGVSLGPRPNAKVTALEILKVLGAVEARDRLETAKRLAAPAAFWYETMPSCPYQVRETLAVGQASTPYRLRSPLCRANLRVSTPGLSANPIRALAARRRSDGSSKEP